MVTALLGPMAARASAPTASPSSSAASSTSPDAAARAQERFNAGTAHYNLGEWDQAIAEYKAAYLLDTQPRYLWAIAQAQRMKGDFELAIKTYQAFKRSGVSAELAARADAQIVVCEEAIKNRPPPVSSAKPSTSSAPPIASPTTPASKPAADPWYGDVLGHGLFWSGVAVAAVGGYLLVTGNRDASAAASAPDYDTWRKHEEAAPTKQTLGVIGLSVGGALVGLGAMRFVFKARAHDDTRTVGLAVGPLSIALGGSF